MRIAIRWALLGAAFLATPAAAAPGAVAVVQPWSRPAAAGTTGVGYMTLVNRGRAPDALVGVESPAAARVEMHASSMAGGMMRMTRERRVEIPAAGQAAFGPGGRHLMFIGLKSALKPGDRLPATLTFASGAKTRIEFVVGSGLGPPGAMPMMHAQGGR